MKSIILVAVDDYFVTRPIKKHIIKAVVGLLPAIGVWFLLRYAIFNEGIEIDEVFSNFVNIQISAIAILISFSIAIITILVSAENDNIKLTKDTASNECKPARGKDKPISVFQVLLSNITYNVVFEAFYLLFLIGCIFAQMFITENVIRVLMAICVFCAIHIFHVLLESVGQMYLTFWRS
jgi:hypothetical protein